MKRQRIPTKITLDAYAASHRAVAQMKQAGELPKRVKVRSSKYLNKSEQHHRTGPPAREATASPDARTEELRHRGGGDQWHRVNRKDQEGTVQNRQAGRIHGNHTGDLASGPRCITWAAVNRTGKTARMQLYLEFAPEPGKVLGRYKMGKHFLYTIGEGKFQWSRREQTIEQEAKLDGIYVIRTSESVARLSAADTVRSYKSLAQVERAFRTLKGMDLLIRPIRHRTEDRVPAHIFLCLLAYSVEWHLRRAWAPLLFEDEELAELRRQRDPILPATGSPSAQAKKLTRQTADGFPVHSFGTLMAELASRARVTYGLKSQESTPSFQQVPEPTPLQAKAYALLALLPVVGT
jgi:hypothetical protein